MGRRTEQLLALSTEENVRLRENLRRAQQTASDLQLMHEALNERIQRGQVGVALSQRQLNELSTKEHRINMEKTAVESKISAKDAEITRLREERDESKRAAEQARVEFAAANERIKQYEEDMRDLRATVERERRRIAENDAEIRETEAENKRLSVIIAERTRQYADDIATHAADTADAVKTEYASVLRRMEEERRVLAERLASAELEKRTAESAKSSAEQKIQLRVATHKSIQTLYDEARRKSAELEEHLALANAKQREAGAAVEVLRDQLQSLAADRARTAEEYARRAAESAVERERLSTELHESQRMLEAAQTALRVERENNAKNAQVFHAANDVEKEREFSAVAADREALLLAQVEEMKSIADESEKRAAQLQAREEQSAVLSVLQQQRHDEEVAMMALRLDEATQSLLVAQRRASQIEAQSSNSTQQLQEQETKIRALQHKLDEQQKLLSITGISSSSSSSGNTTPRRDAAKQRTLSRKMSLMFDAATPVETNGTTAAATTTTPVSPRAADNGGKKPGDVTPPEHEKELEEMSAQQANALNNEEFMEGVCDMVADGKVARITEYLNDGLSPNTQDFLRRPLLEVAVRRVHELYKKERPSDVEKKTLKAVVQLVPLLLQRGGIWKSIDDYLTREIGFDDALPSSLYEIIRKRDDMSPFSTAVARGNFEEAIKHIAKVEDLDRRPTIPERHAKEGFSYLHIAVYEESVMLTQVLVQGGANVNVVDNKKRTPLHLVLVKCQDRRARLTITQFLLAGGASTKALCSYQKLLNDCKARMEKITPGSTTPSTPVPGMHIDAMARLSSETEKYGSPLKLAESLGDAELLECMRNRRYLAVDRATLTEYIETWALLHSRVDSAIAEGVIKPSDNIYVLFRRYKDVFLAFNPRHNYVNMMCRMYDDADVDRVKDKADVAERKMTTIYAQDSETIVKYMQSGGARTKTLDRSLTGTTSSSSSTTTTTEKTHANATYEWRIGDLLIKCVNALEKHWFDVSSLIQQRATELYADAVLDAVCKLVRVDDAHGVNAVLCRPYDRLFGAGVDLNTIVDRKLKFTAIELAAYYGSINTLESLMAQQRNDITRKGLSNRTIAQIAVRGQQPLALVAIDAFMFKNLMTEAPHTHADDYGLLTEELENSVLHEAARTSRDDLMRHCIDEVRFQLSRRNKGGQTPLDVAEQMIHWGMPTRKIEMAKTACKQILTEAIEGKLFGKNSPSGGGSQRLSITLASLSSPPPLPQSSVLVTPASSSSLLSAKTRRPTTGRHRRPTPTMVLDHIDSNDDNDDDFQPPPPPPPPPLDVPPPLLTGGAATSKVLEKTAGGDGDNDDDSMTSIESDDDDDDNSTASEAEKRAAVVVVASK